LASKKLFVNLAYVEFKNLNKKACIPKKIFKKKEKILKIVKNSYCFFLYFLFAILAYLKIIFGMFNTTSTMYLSSYFIYRYACGVTL
jgi:hypothetical protein